MRTEFDVIVIGGGAMGTATARVLAERGRSTLLLERFEIGHSRGSSGGPTRIFRLAHLDERDVRMAKLALEGWRELEDRAGERLLIPVAGLDIGQGLDEIAAALGSNGVPATRTSGAAANERWPALRLPSGLEVLTQEDAGVIMAARVLRAQTRLASQAGATIAPNRPVERLRADGFGVEVDTPEATYHSTIAVLAAGPWMSRLLEQAGHPLPLTPTLEQVTYFELEEPSPLPVIVDRTTDRLRSVYSVPNPELPGSFKVALHHAGPTVDPDARSFDPDPERVDAVTSYAGERFGPHRATGVTETCLYTNTPDLGFVLDRRGPLVIGSACSGHGFKFTPLIGRILADLATAQPAPMPIERFLSDRASLGD